MPENTKRRLAITAISGNESKWVEQWVKSFLPIADIFVINLTQYDDNSEELFRKFIPEDKLILVKNPWEKSFSKARNQGLELVPDWVDYCAYFDLDEELTKGSANLIREFLNSDEDFIPLVTIYNTLDQKGMAASLYYPRIWPNKLKGNLVTPRPYFDGTVHNQLILDRNIPVVRTGISIMHYGYALSPEEMKKKHARSEELLRQQIVENNDNFFAHLNLAQLLRAKGEFQETAREALEVLRIVEPKIMEGEKQYVHAQLMSLDQLSTALLAQQKNKEAIPYIEKALQIKPDYLDAIVSMGNVNMELKDYGQAEYWYKRYLFVRSNYDVEKDNTNLILNHLNSSFIVLYNLGVVYAIQSNFKEALKYFLRSYNEEPLFRDVAIKVIHTYKVLGDQKNFNSFVNEFVNAYPSHHALIYEYFGDMAIEQAEIEKAKFNYYQAAFTKFEDESIHGRVLRKWNNIKDVFGDVSMHFFDTSKAKNDIINKVESYA